MKLRLRRSAARSTLLLAAALVFSSAWAQVIDSTFIASSGSWHDSANWSPAVVPDNGGGVTYNVTISTNSTVQGMSSAVTISDFTTSGDASFKTNQTLTIEGALTHQTGTWAVDGATPLVFNGASTLGGNVDLSNGAGIQNSGTMTVGINSRVRDITLGTPVAPFGGNNYNFVNTGTATWNSTHDVGFQSYKASNTGTMNLHLASSQFLVNTYDQIASTGTRTTVVGATATLAAANALNLTAGFVYGNGTYQSGEINLGNGTNAGSFVSPGGGAGLAGSLTLSGTLGTIGGATLHFDIGGLGQGTTYDLLTFTDDANFNNVALEFGFINGYTPTPGDSFAIATTGGLFSGAFANMNGGVVAMAGLGTFDVSINGQSLVLSNFTSTAIPEPEHATLLAAAFALGAIAWRKRRRGRRPPSLVLNSTRAWKAAGRGGLLVSAGLVFLNASAQIIDSTFIASSGSWNDSANWSPAAVPDNGGGFTYNVTISADSTINAMTSDITINNAATAGNATFTNDIANRTLTINGTASHESGTLLIQAPLGLILNGTTTVHGNLELRNGAGVQNNGTLTVGSGASLEDTTPTAPAPRFTSYHFVNNGTATIQTAINVEFSNFTVLNTGTMNLQLGSGAKFIAGTYDQSAGSGARLTTVGAGATLQANNLNLAAGFVYGNGTYNGSSFTLGNGTSTGATVSAGDGAGLAGSLTLAGNLNTIGGATLHFDLGGLGQGTTYDLLTFANNVNFNNVALELGFIDGYTPGPTDSYTIALTSGNFSGTFANLSGGTVTMPGLGTFDVTINAQSVVLSNFTSTAIPEPGHVALLAAASALGAVVAWRKRRRGRRG